MPTPPIQQTREQMRAKWQTVACPRCSVAAGEQCKTPTGHRRNSTHRERIEAYRQAEQKAKP